MNTSLRILLALALLLFASKLMAQTAEPYASQWKKADSLINRGLPESARKIVDKLYSDAQASGQQVQMLKAQLYLMRINASNKEDADSLNIAFAEGQIGKTAFPVSAVWQSIAAQLYWDYYTRNRYLILDQTRTATGGGDFQQWDASKFVERTSALYLQSISRADELKRINIEQYDPVLIKGINTRTLRPTLFDLLAFRAIDFFENDEKDVTKPAYQFVMDDASSFAPATEFIRHRFATQDTSSLHHRALTLYQEVLRLHQNDASPDAFIDADLQRLAFAYAHSVHPDKKELYRKALERIEKQYAANPLSATASYRIAELMFSTEDLDIDVEHNPEEGAKRPKADLRAVKARLDAIIAKYLNSEGGVAAQQLLRSILTQSLHITAEEAVLPNEPSKVLINYRNAPKAFIRVVKLNATEFLSEEFRYGNDRLSKALLGAQALQTFSVSLPGTEDYHQHGTEVKINPLPLGMYAVVVSADEAFSKENNAISYAIFQSTRLAVVTQGSGLPNVPAGYVLHRRNGEPVAGASVQFLNPQWNSKAQRYEYNRTAPISTGADGAFQVSGSDRSYSGILVRKDDDVFQSSAHLGFYRNTPDNQNTEQTFFFTDRSIYRPGQTIYFKGIMLRSSADRRAHDVIAGKNVAVTFYDANGQEIASQTLTTNEWGSVTGTFTAPQSGLTGQMRIEGGNGAAYVSVEEYKRPKFRVDWDTLKTDYALNESVSITGYAQAYAGNNVDGATVKYRVVRNVRWPFWWYSWRWGGGRSEQQQMAEGTTTTEANGKFNIRFTALPDRSIDERSLPVFTYTVYADVTDLNGETRSGQKSISAGYRSLQIVADIPEQVSRTDLDTVRITTQNLNGDFVPANISIRIARLNQPDVVYRKRLWPVPDQFVMSEGEFRKAFPLDAYKDEDDYRKWNEADITLERTVTTNSRGLVPIPSSAFFANGWYCITTSTKDKNGKVVEEKKFVQVWDVTGGGEPYAMILVQPTVKTLEPNAPLIGDVIHVASAMEKGYFIQQVQTMDGRVTTNGFIAKPIDPPHRMSNGLLFGWNKEITEADRGGIALSYLTVKDNRVYTASAHINVPWTNKDLDIEWATHRDKLQPGQQETWTMIVRGNKKDKVAAELMAALYDASLDAFQPHSWSRLDLFPTLHSMMNSQTNIGFNPSPGRQLAYFSSKSLPHYNKTYDNLIHLEGRGRYLGNFKRGRTANTMAVATAAPERAEAEEMADGVLGQAAKAPVQFTPPSIQKDASAEEVAPGPDVKPPAPKDIPLRKNLQETAFFYPQLRTDADGSVRISFTIPEALTEWKLLTFAHTKDMKMGVTSGTVKTQKDLMVQPGLPRFLRQGDQLTLSAKIVNLTDRDISGDAELEIIDAQTGKALVKAFGEQEGSYMFSAPKGGSTVAKWYLRVPESRYEPVLIRIRAKAGNFSDGEENMLPVITNRMLVTETMPMWMNGAGSKTFSFDKLKASSASNTLAQHRLTVEYTSNPAWYAVQALPYLMEYPYECAEQVFNRYYANALAAHILDKAPKVKEIFRRWETDTVGMRRGAFLSLHSPLEKNQELKSALLEETPWVLDAQNETQQRKNIALLFQTAKLARDLDKTARQLEDMMLPEGGWPWFKGDNRPDRFITQYIITGIGRLQRLGVRNARIEQIAERAVNYLDRKLNGDYNALVRRKADMKAQHISYFEAQYLYMRSFFKSIPVTQLSAAAQAFYKKQAQEFWPRFNPYVKGMIGLAMHRSGDKQTAATIIQSLKETSIQKEELGMYWMEKGRSWWWWEAPIEAQSLLIECFSEVAGDNESVDKMKRWLLKQKQTQNWGTTKATADACYALLLQGTQWLTSEPQVSIQLGDKNIRSQDFPQEAGSGYFKVQYPGTEVKPDMGNITLTIAKTSQPVNISTAQPSWGAVYWQYFENLDKITAAATPLQVRKQLFIERNSDRGPVLTPITDNASLKVGDKVKARIEIIVDRDMEYVHLKDARAACFEPTNVLSGYRWQGGLGYYESTRDVSSNFFFSYLPKGKYVFEYPMFVTNAGDFSAGLATIQCMYAPEFSAHSQGVRISVK